MNLKDVANEEILSAIHAAASMMDEEMFGDGQVLVTKAVITFCYVDSDGQELWGYRRVKASPFDLGGAGAMLTAAYQTLWIEESVGDDE